MRLGAQGMLSFAIHSRVRPVQCLQRPRVNRPVFADVRLVFVARPMLSPLADGCPTSGKEPTMTPISWLPWTPMLSALVESAFVSVILLAEVGVRAALARVRR